MEELWNRVQYANLLLHGHVSEYALLVLCSDILLERGCVPVGEIGKLLQELTGSVSMSAILKDRFGGLKKFLELYPRDFLIRFAAVWISHLFHFELLFFVALN